MCTRNLARQTKKSETQREMRARGKILGLVPSGLQASNLERARGRFCNAGDERFLVPVIFGAGFTVNPGSAPHYIFSEFLLALIPWWLCVTRRG